jgi:hypothetical protein
MQISEPRTLRELLGGAMEILRAESNKITKAIFLFWLLPSVPFFIALFSFFQSIPYELLRDNPDLQPDQVPTEVIGQMVLIIPTAIMVSLFAGWGYTIMVSIAASYREGENLSVRGHAIETIKGPFWSMLAIVICTGIIGMIVMGIIGMVVRPDGGAGSAALYQLINMIVTFGMQVWIYASVPSIVHESKGPVFGVDQSIKLTKNHFMQTLGRYLAIIAMTVAVMVLLGLIGVMIMVGILGSGNSDPAAVLQSLTNFNTLFSIFLGFLPMMLALLFAMVFEPLYRTEVYFDL